MFIYKPELTLTHLSPQLRGICLKAVVKVLLNNFLFDRKHVYKCFRNTSVSWFGHRPANILTNNETTQSFPFSFTFFLMGKNVHRYSVSELLSQRIWCPSIFSSTLRSKSTILVLVAHGGSEVRHCGSRLPHLFWAKTKPSYIFFLWSEKGLSIPRSLK